MIDAAQKFNVPVGKETREIAGPIQPSFWFGGKGVGNELLSRLLWLIKIAVGQSGSTHAKLARNSNRDRPEVSVNNIKLLVRHRPPEWNSGGGGSAANAGLQDKRAAGHRFRRCKTIHYLANSVLSGFS